MHARQRGLSYSFSFASVGIVSLNGVDSSLQNSTTPDDATNATRSQKQAGAHIAEVQGKERTLFHGCRRPRYQLILQWVQYSRFGWLSRSFERLTPHHHPYLRGICCVTSGAPPCVHVDKISLAMRFSSCMSSHRNMLQRSIVALYVLIGN
ncbi:hypothetical protein F5Y05DRAFT_388655 [Hypoxylon sp. FL0543]|nr:hypothetical protein F5Y05DRAFT_388655 [Hypoxylon sp. FL0543]